MFIWTWRQVVVFFVLVVVFGFTFISPAWSRVIHAIYIPLFIVVAVLAFIGIMRKNPRG